MNDFIKLVRPTAVSLLLFTLLFGGLYPWVTTHAVALLFPAEVEGSLLRDNQGNAIGSSLIGQNFSQPNYFWGRLSATSPMPYNAASSSGSNFGPNNPALLDAVKARIAALRAADPQNTALIPVDLVTASASGIDPHISPAAAQYQAARVARLRGLPQAQIDALIERATEGRQFGFLGEPRVNVLKLNLMLDRKQ